MILIRSVGSLEGAADVLQTAIWLMRENLTSVKTGAAHLRFEACDRTNHVALTDQMQIHVLQLAKWTLPAPDGPLDVETDYHRYQAWEHWLMLQATLEDSARAEREARIAAEERAKEAQEQAQQAQEQAQQAQEQTQEEQRARQAAEERAARLAARLRALGIDET